MSGRWGSRQRTYLSAAMLLLWIVTIIVLISQRPDPGESSPQALGDAFLQAVQSDDEAEVKRLVRNLPNGERLQAFLEAARCGTSVRATDSRLEIMNGTSVCGRFPIEEEGGRWFIDPWADSLGKRQ